MFMYFFLEMFWYCLSYISFYRVNEKHRSVRHYRYPCFDEIVKIVCVMSDV